MMGLHQPGLKNSRGINMTKLSMVIILSAIVFLFPNIISSSAMADDFDITFKFERQHKCSPTSPKITLSNIPEGTQTFKARLIDHDNPHNHGGGTLANDGSGVLGEGALTEGYNGPCPPSSHLYEITVRALDANGKELASAGKKRMFP
jgi:hypothetical protein